MRRWRYIILAGAVIVFAGMMVAWPSGSLPLLNPASEQSPDRPAQDTPDERLSVDSNEGPILTKRSTRDMGRKPTEEETQNLLKTTIITKIDIKDATLEETVAELNRLTRSLGISERELTILIDHRVPKDLRSSFRVRELRIRNAPLVVLMKYVCGRTKIRIELTPGRVTFCHQDYRDDFDELPAPAGKKETGPDGDPFAGPGTEVQAEKMSSDPDDPFSHVDSEEPDPFAEPE